MWTVSDYREAVHEAQWIEHLLTYPQFRKRADLYVRHDRLCAMIQTRRVVAADAQQHGQGRWAA